MKDWLVAILLVLLGLCIGGALLPNRITETYMITPAIHESADGSLRCVLDAELREVRVDE